MRTRKIMFFALIGAGLVGFMVSGCSTVRPYEREYLADQIMDYRREAREERVDQKWLEAREGSTGGAIGAGGGCACN
jgi:hypothetical protein